MPSMEMLLNTAKFMLASKGQGLSGIKQKCQLAARQGIGREVEENIPAQALSYQLSFMSYRESEICSPREIIVIFCARHLCKWRWLKH